MIRTTRTTSASPATIHRLLVDITAWKLWSPHVASVEPAAGTLSPGDVVRTRAFFSPVVTPMHVDWVRDGQGIGWHTDGPAGVTLRYENRVEPAEGGGAKLVWEATLEGAGAAALEAVTKPLSALGQRRRMQRLTALAELVERSG